MKITFLLPQLNLMGGTRVAAIYARKLADAGHTVRVYSMRAFRPTCKQQLKALLTGKGWLRRPAPQLTYFASLGVPTEFLESDQIRDDALPDADVLVTTWWETAYKAVELSPSKGAKVYFIQGHDAAFPGRVQADKIKATYMFPMHPVVVSGWLRDVFRDDYGRTDVSLVPNSVDTELFESPPRGKQAVPTVGTLYSDRYVIKGCDVAFKAVEKARKTVPNLRFVVFGASDAPPDLPPGTEYFKAPPQSDIPKLYARCDAWLFPSRMDGFGLPILEAMACRTPVIATPVGAAPDLVEQGGGAMIGLDDADAMAEQIVRFAQMSEDAWKQRSNTAHRIAHEYTWDDATARMQAALERALAAHVTPEPVRAASGA